MTRHFINNPLTEKEVAIIKAILVMLVLNMFV